jgi:hypothetical protein
MIATFWRIIARPTKAGFQQTSAAQICCAVEKRGGLNRQIPLGLRAATRQSTALLKRMPMRRTRSTQENADAAHALALLRPASEGPDEGSTTGRDQSVVADTDLERFGTTAAERLREPAASAPEPQ